MEPLRTPRMTLRPLEAADRSEYVRVHEVSESFFIDWIPALPAGETWNDLFEQELEKNGKENHLRMVGIRSDGRIAGLFNLGEIVRGFFHSAYAGWRTNVECVRQGFGAEGVRGLLDVAFSTDFGLGLHRVQANIMPENLASIRLARRVGFRNEGVALKYLKIAGTWRDHLMFAKLAEEHLPSHESLPR